MSGLETEETTFHEWDGDGGTKIKNPSSRAKKLQLRSGGRASILTPLIHYTFIVWYLTVKQIPPLFCLVARQNSGGIISTRSVEAE